MQVQSVKIEYDSHGSAVVMRVGAIGSELMEPLSFPFELPGPNIELAGMDEASFDRMLAEPPRHCPANVRAGSQVLARALYLCVRRAGPRLIDPRS